MTSPTDKWVQTVRATDMWGRVNGHHWPVNGQYGLGLKRALAGSGWAGLGWAGPDTWHAVVLPRHCHGLLLGFVHSSAHAAWFTVDSGSRSMDHWLVFGGPSPLSFPFGLAHVH